MSRPECRRMDSRIKQLEASLRSWAQRLETERDPEERDRIRDTMNGLENSIQELDTDLFEAGCYEIHGPIIPGIKVPTIEVTQSTQYHHLLGTGAGRTNSVPLVAFKLLLARVFVENVFHEELSATGRISVMVWNPNTLKYDKLRRTLDPVQPIVLAGASTSERRRMRATLNFLMPAADCRGRLSLNAQVWAEGHQSDPYYRGTGSVEIEFDARRIPIIHCFRINLTRLLPTMPPSSVTIAAPTDADCRGTMELAERMFPVQDLDIRDRGVRPYTGSLQNTNDYDEVRQDIQAVRDGTTPTPAEHEIFLAMLPTHAGPNRIITGTALNGSIESTVWLEQMFAHELGHLLLPGDDHVFDGACGIPGVAMDQIDTSYPDYPNAIQRAGIGEWGVDLGQSPIRLHAPETPDIMSYCNPPQWISPYNYMRAYNGDLLNPFDERSASLADSQKLLVSLRLHRDGRAELNWALHLPGEPRRYTAKGQTDTILELYGANATLVASSNCHRAADRPDTAPYEDFLETLPWFDAVSSVAVVRKGKEVARWAVEDSPSEPVVRKLSMAQKTRSGGGKNVVISWDKPKKVAKLHQMLRYTPDEGKTWIPIANGIQSGEVEIGAELFRGLVNCRFQLAVSTGFRTTLVESTDKMSWPEATREIAIIQPRNNSILIMGEPVQLVGRTGMWFDGRQDPVHAYWTSNRDGYLADGLRAVVSGLSAGPHVIRLVTEDDSRAEISDRVMITVEEISRAPKA